MSLYIARLDYLVLSNYENCIYHEEDSTIEYHGDDILVFPATDAKSALQILKEHEINEDIFAITTTNQYQ